jgi:hypothetical protein
MSTAMDEYVKRKAALEQATAARALMLGRLHETTKAMMQSPDLFHFANCQHGGFPPEVIMNRAAPSADANGWPTAQQIQDVLVAWHNARGAAVNAWRALSGDEQKVMQPL